MKHPEIHYEPSHTLDYVAALRLLHFMGSVIIVSMLLERFGSVLRCFVVLGGVGWCLGRLEPKTLRQNSLFTKELRILQCARQAAAVTSSRRHKAYFVASKIRHWRAGIRS